MVGRMWHPEHCAGSPRPALCDVLTGKWDKMKGKQKQAWSREAALDM